MTIDQNFQIGELQGAQSQQRQPRGSDHGTRADADVGIEYEAERRSIREFVSLARQIRMQSHVRGAEWNGFVVGLNLTLLSKVLGP